MAKKTSIGNIGKMVMEYAASPSNPPRRFRNLDVAFKFRGWCRRNNMTGSKSHNEAVKKFCQETGEEYKKDW